MQVFLQLFIRYYTVKVEFKCENFQLKNMNVEFDDKITEILTKIAKKLKLKLEDFVKKIVEKELRWIENQKDEEEFELFANVFYRNK